MLRCHELWEDSLSYTLQTPDKIHDLTNVHVPCGELCQASKPTNDNYERNKALPTPRHTNCTPPNNDATVPSLEEAGGGSYNESQFEENYFVDR
jgi:hypothetical protein